MPDSQSSLSRQMEEMRSDMREMRGAMTKIAEAISKLAVLEERHHNFSSVTERRLSLVEMKTEETQMEQVKHFARIEGVSKTIKIMWIAFGGGVMYVGSQLMKLVFPELM